MEIPCAFLTLCLCIVCQPHLGYICFILCSVCVCCFRGRSPLIGTWQTTRLCRTSDTRDRRPLFGGTTRLVTSSEWWASLPHFLPSTLSFSTSLHLSLSLCLFYASLSLPRRQWPSCCVWAYSDVRPLLLVRQGYSFPSLSHRFDGILEANSHMYQNDARSQQSPTINSVILYYTDWPMYVRVEYHLVQIAIGCTWNVVYMMYYMCVYTATGIVAVLQLGIQCFCSCTYKYLRMWQHMTRILWCGE